MSDNLFQNNGEARKVIKIKGEYEISFDMLKVPTLNIKKLDEKFVGLKEKYIKHFGNNYNCITYIKFFCGNCR